MNYTMGEVRTLAAALVSGGGYNYDPCKSIAIRLQFDHATTIRRPMLRPGCCTAA